MIGLLGVLLASDAAPGMKVVAPPVDVPEPPPGFPDFIRKMARDPLREDSRALAITVGPEGEFSGRVIDRQGQPVVGVLVDAWDWCPGNETRTAADGTFRLTRLDPQERIEVRFIKEGFAPYTVIKQPLGALAQPLVLDTQTYWEGQVTGPDGQPVANAWIRANQGPQQADGVFIGSIWTETRSDARGHYKLLVQNDTYELQVTSPAGLVARLPEQVIAAQQRVELNLALKPGIVFRARVVDSETGKPVPGVTLDDWEHPTVKGITDAEGNLQIAGLIPGKFEFQVKATGYARWWSEECSDESDRRKIENSGWQRNFDGLHYELAPNMAPVIITLEKAVRIRGRIVDPNGRPVAGATAGPALTGTGNSLTGDTRYSVETKPDGSFEMLLPASGERNYNLIAHDGGYREWRNWANGITEPFRTKPGQEIEGFELKLKKPATVRGRVVDAEGIPVALREVRAQAADFRENRYYDPTTRTDAEGRFEIKFIRSGKHRVQVAPYTNPLGHPEASWLTEIAEGQVVESPDLTIPEPL
jgi:protocatechuate 3,4-dioxygenase beta subunit